MVASVTSGLPRLFAATSFLRPKIDEFYIDDFTAEKGKCVIHHVGQINHLGANTILWQITLNLH